MSQRPECGRLDSVISLGGNHAADREWAVGWSTHHWPHENEIRPPTRSVETCRDRVDCAAKRPCRRPPLGLTSHNVPLSQHAPTYLLRHRQLLCRALDRQHADRRVNGAGDVDHHSDISFGAPVLGDEHRVVLGVRVDHTETAVVRPGDRVGDVRISGIGPGRIVWAVFDLQFVVVRPVCLACRTAALGKQVGIDWLNLPAGKSLTHTLAMS